VARADAFDPSLELVDVTRILIHATHESFCRRRDEGGKVLGDHREVVRPHAGIELERSVVEERRAGRDRGCGDRFE